MNLKAREVWIDAQQAVDLMELSEDPQTTRILYVASVALLRTIGDVLDKVDKLTENPEVRTAIEEHWASLKQSSNISSHIFWGFIKGQRDEIVHRYAVDAELLNDPLVVIGSDDAGSMTELSGPYLIDRFVLRSGAFAGVDGRDLARDALEWWDGELKQIEGAKA